MVDASVIAARPAIVLTRSDRDRVTALKDHSTSHLPTTEFLRQEIHRAEIIPDDASASVVTMGSRVRFIDHHRHKVSEVHLAFPDETDAHSVSVLTPLGSALLGLGPGQTIEWKDDVGWDCTLTVVAILPRTTER